MNNEYGPFVLLWFHGLGLWAFFLSLNIGQNGPLALIFEIFGPETLFEKYIGKYHFLWYSSLVSSSTPFFYSTVAPDVGI